MAQFASDTFTDTAGTGLNTHDANWTLHTSYSTGGCVITDANRVRRSTSNNTLFWHAGTPASADYEVSGDLFAKETDGGASSAGVVGRVDTAANTCYHWRYGGGTTDGWQLFKFVGGTATQLGSTSSQSLTDETAYAHKLRMVGTTIEGYKQGSGSPTVSVTDSAISAAGKAGMRWVGTGELNTTGLHIDNFSADDVGGGAYSMAAATGTFALTGQVAGLSAARKLAAGAGSFALTGQAAALRVARTLTAAAGSFTLTGNDATLTYTPAGGDPVMPAGTGAFSLTGNTAGLTVARKLVAATGAFSLTGQDATLTRSGYRLPAAPGSFVLTGNAASLSTTGAVERRSAAAGRPSRTRRARVVEIDGEDFIVNSAEEAEALLENAREQAKQLAATAVKRAAAAERRPARKVIADARRLLETPEIKAPEDLQPLAEQARADIEAIYQSALASVEIAALLARRQREEEDDEDVLMLIA